MARQARVKSVAGIYHIMLKGLDGRNIFLDDADRSIFMEKLNRAREIGGYRMTTKESHCYDNFENYYTFSYIDQIWSLLKKTAFGGIDYQIVVTSAG